MLYRNDVKYDLTQDDTDFVYKFMGWDIKNKFKNRPAVIKIPESMYIFDKANNRKIRPNRCNIPLTETEFIDDIGSVTWTYTASIPVMENGKPKFARSHHAMTGTFSVGTDKIDFLFYLIKSKYRERMADEDKTKQASKPLFRVEMKEKESAIKLRAHKIKTTIESYINGPSGIVWPDEKIIKYAYAFGIEDAEDMGPNEVRSTLLGRVAGEPNGYARFYDLIENSEKAEDVFTIKTLESKGLIGKNTKKWFWINDGKPGEQICLIKPKKGAEESLLEELEENEQIKELFKQAIENL